MGNAVVNPLICCRRELLHYMPDRPFVSVVIPVWGDDEALIRRLEHVCPCPQVEVIVACVLGEESRYQRHRECHPQVSWVSAPRGRAVQMNAGAAIARGRWLLFLHADSELPGDWLQVLIGADRRAGTVAGAFRLAIASRAWQARVIEHAVRLRVALFGMPYGDQALFVRKDVFEGIGGYDDLPLMEDVDLVRRLRAAGPMVHSRSPVLTSARRWERDGWLRRSGQNLYLAARFLMGASPGGLARTYFRRRRSAVIMMGRAPWTGGKTRLDIAPDEDAHADLRHALFLDTLDVITSIPAVEHIVACEPADACKPMRALVGPAVDVFAQRGRDLGERLAHVFEDAFRLGFGNVVVVGSDLPDLPALVIGEAIAHLGRGAEVVVGPAVDGGYYLVGLKRPYRALFEMIDWGTERVLPQTLAAAANARLTVTLLETCADVDQPSDFERLRRQPSHGGAPRTRAWASAHLRSWRNDGNVSDVA